MSANTSGNERRQYIRLDSVFPVEFQILSLDRERSLSGCLQGFSNNIGKGGICLAVNNLTPELAQPLKERKAVLTLQIEMPLSAPSVKATAKVAWIEPRPGCPNSYLIGLSYEKIDAVANNRLLRYARAKKMALPVLIGIVIVLGVGFGLNSYINARLVKGNEALVAQLISIVQRSSIAKQKVKAINKEREDLQTKLKALELEIRTAEEEGAGYAGRKKQELLLLELNRKKELLRDKLIAIQDQEAAVTEDLLQLDRIKHNLEEVNLERMYKWLQMRQNLHSGLLVSVEGENQRQDQAFTYEQALAARAYTDFSDFERARLIFKFFNQQLRADSEGLFPSAYYAESGQPLEGPWQSGPNIALAIAAANYTLKANDQRYLPMAEEIAARIMRLQQQDKDGGIPSAEEALYYYAKDNLEAYGLFNMLYSATGKREYRQAAALTLDWLLNNIYDENGVRVPPAKVNIESDNFAWAIAAIGPEKLEALGVNPDRVIEFAETHCGVKSCYIRPGGESVELKGFDFVMPKGAGREGIISSERTAQMVIAFRIIADYYYQKGMPAKARAYASKISEYLSELDNLVISSDSARSKGESCLPYASQDVPDTAGGIIRKSCDGSLGGTAYALFAYYNYNPLEP